MMTRQSLLIIPVLLLLGSCDAATEIAGDTLQGEMRRGVVVQCQQVAEGAGIAAGRVSAVCQCAADTFMADGPPSLADINREKLQGIVDACVAQTDPDGVGR